MTIKNPDLRRALKGIEEKNVLVPRLHASLNDPTFKAFTVQVEEWTPRPPDGYFHPSTQATWSARQMALYLIAPQLFEVERMTLTSVLAITQGHFWHMFIQHVLNEDGILIEDEVSFTDELHKRRGHMDGLLNVRGEAEGLEIKTMNSHTLAKINNEAELKDKKYEYWCQAQEYLDAFDLKKMRFLIITPDYPFNMKEFVVKANPLHQGHRRKAYRDAIETASKMSLPLSQDDGPSCCGRPDTCVARFACMEK